MTYGRRIERVRGLLRAARGAGDPIARRRLLAEAREALDEARAILDTQLPNRWLTIGPLLDAHRQALDAIARALQELEADTDAEVDGSGERASSA